MEHRNATKLQETKRDSIATSFDPPNQPTTSSLKQTACHQKQRRQFLSTAAFQAISFSSIGSLFAVAPNAFASMAFAPKASSSAWRQEDAQDDESGKAKIELGLQWLASQQSRLGQWQDATYEVAITALAGLALICSGSTTMQGPYSKQIRLTVDFLVNRCRTNGLIGNPAQDNRYTYGHGFSMLFLSQVLGEEEDSDRRKSLTSVLQRAVEFSVSAQTNSGGWGYVSAKDGSNFDEGSTTITQVQGLRGCRNAGIAVPGKAIEKAKKYIYDCKNDDGGISYSSNNRGTSRPAITAAALAALYNAGDYDSKHVPEMLKYCQANLKNIATSQYGHWHYTFLYYAQVMYRQDNEVWQEFRKRLQKHILSKQQTPGSWPAEQNGEFYSTACNLIMLQLDYGYLPIFQR